MQTQGYFLGEPVQRLFDKIQQYLPNLFQALLIFVVGLVIGLAVRFLFSWLLGMTKLDAVAEKTGTADLLRRSGIRQSFSGFLSRVAGGLMVVVFTCVAVVALDIPATEQFIEKVLLYLPNVFAAGFILLAGYILGNFLGRAVLIACVNAGINMSGTLARGTRWAVGLLSATMALEQMDIGGETIIIAFGVILGGIVLALALAFGLGARDIARRYLEGKMEGVPERDQVGHY